MLQQKIPTKWEDRESLRDKGQFWTPSWIAEAMVAYVIGNGTAGIFDPAVGSGAFFLAAKKLSKELGLDIQLEGAEIDPCALEEAKQNGISTDELAGVKIRDFIFSPTSELLSAVVANPPYIRHHRLSDLVKSSLRDFSFQILGTSIDGRAGYHIYFLLRALQLLKTGGRLAFIMPADTCEGVFSLKLWKWITEHYRLHAVISFAPNASPFPRVDTNPLIFMIENSQPQPVFIWARCLKANSEFMKTWVQSTFRQTFPGLTVMERDLQEGLLTGLSRPPMKSLNQYVLGNFARVMRGIATGANDFFFLTRERAYNLKIPPEFLVPAIGRTRDVKDKEVTREMLARLDACGRPTLLFAPDGRPLDRFPESVQRYLSEGERMGLPNRALIATRQPWYKMESRAVPPLLFTYLGRRRCRFLLNRANIVPLTGFLCIYPFDNSPASTKKLHEVLQDPETLENIKYVAKSYGDGALKVEPKFLERLQLSDRVVRREALAASSIRLKM